MATCHVCWGMLRFVAGGVSLMLIQAAMIAVLLNINGASAIDHFFTLVFGLFIGVSQYVYAIPLCLKFRKLAMPEAVYGCLAWSLVVLGLDWYVIING